MSRWVSTSASGCSMSPAPGRATTSSCRCTARRPGKDPKPSTRTNAELLVEGMGARLDELPDARRDRRRRSEVGRRSRRRRRLRSTSWLAERTAALDRAALAGTVAATALTDEGMFDADAELGAEPDPGLQKRPRDLDLPPWLKGRYGSAVGRAVHGVLQTIDLVTGEGLEATLAAQCEAEAVLERAGDVRRLVEAALGSPSVHEAAAHRYWREVYVCAPVGDRLLEGYIDLLYRVPEGLVVVDYKTSASSDPGRAHPPRRVLPQPGRVVRTVGRGRDRGEGGSRDVLVPHAGRCRRAPPRGPRMTRWTMSVTW